MAHDITADRKPFDFTSPIAQLQFGKHKGEVMWTIGLSSLEWMDRSLTLTDRARQTIHDAKEMFVRSGEYAVMRNIKGDKWECKLQGIYSSKSIADAHTNIGEGYEDFVYHIKE
jgi:hypothetical protein